MAAGKPLTLKDFLELDCESSSNGFRCYPRRLGDAAVPVRHLLDAELRRRWSPTRTPPRSPTLARISHLSRNLSRRLRGGFWRRREETGDEEEALDEQDSCGLPSPVVSSCAESDQSESDTESESESGKKSAFDFAQSSSASSASLDGMAAAAADAADEQKVLKDERTECNLEMDDKQQLSPVSVMDFPFDDDDDEVEQERNVGACSSPFYDSLSHIEGTKTQPQHKIRRFESLAELGPVDLEARFDASDSENCCSGHPGLQCSSDGTTPRADEHRNPDGLHQFDDEAQEPYEHRLLGLVKADAAVSFGMDDVSERLLLDFFIERRCSSGRVEFHAATRALFGALSEKEDMETLGDAKDWLRGAGPRWGLVDVLRHGEAAVAEMEGSRRWMCAGEDWRDVGAAVEGLVMDELVDELVRGLVL